MMWLISGMSTKLISSEISPPTFGICMKLLAQFPTPLGQRRRWNNINQWSSLVPSLNWREISFLSQDLTFNWNSLSGHGFRTKRNKMLIDERKRFMSIWMSGSTVFVILMSVLLFTRVNAGLMTIFLIKSSIWNISKFFCNIRIKQRITYLGLESSTFDWVCCVGKRQKIVDLTKCSEAGLKFFTVDFFDSVGYIIFFFFVKVDFKIIYLEKMTIVWTCATEIEMLVADR